MLSCTVLHISELFMGMCKVKNLTAFSCKIEIADSFEIFSFITVIGPFNYWCRSSFIVLTNNKAGTLFSGVSNYFENL